MKRIILTALAVLSMTVVPVAAQQTTGNIQGRVIDAQRSAIPGVTVTGKERDRPASRAPKSRTPKASTA